MRCFRLMCVLCALLVLSGCSDTEVLVETEEKLAVMDCVSLSEVGPPSFREDFATLSILESSYALYWGDGTGSVVWKESGYPGFGYPIIIECDFLWMEAAEVNLVTNWGEYLYQQVCGGFCFEEDRNLVDSERGKKLVNWGRHEEMLVLWYPETKNYAIYAVGRGTKIVA